MKKLLPILFLTCIVLLLCSCIKDNSGSSFVESNNGQTSMPIEEDSVKMTATGDEKIDEVILRISDKPYQQLITKMYSEKEAFEKDLIRPILVNTSFFVTTISTLEDAFPSECVRQMENNRVYTVHKTQDGGLIYRFYNDDPNFQGNELRWKFSHSIYMKKNLKIADFKSIKLGDSWQKAAKIDPIINYYAVDAEKYQFEGFVTAHMLQDGVMLIYFERDNGQLKVNSIESFPNFIISFDDGSFLDCTILPQDYPN